MSKKIGIAVIGCGIGKFHIEAYKKLDDVNLVAIIDINKEKAKKLQKQYEIEKVFTNYRDALNLPQVDAVSVCTPNFLHSRITIAALKNGKNVLCEKPMAMNCREAEEMARVANREGKILMIAFSHRFRGDSMLLKEWIKRGELGKVYHAQVHAERRRGIPGLGGWFTTKAKSGGGPLIDIGVHALDLTMWLMNLKKPATASSVTYAKFGIRNDYVSEGMWGERIEGGPFDVEDLVSGFIRFKESATISLETSWAGNIEQDTFHSIILGDKGGARISCFESLKIFKEMNGKLVDIYPKYASTQPYESEIAHFVECIKKGRQPIADGESGILVQKIIDAIYESAKRGKEVKVG